MKRKADLLSTVFFLVMFSTITQSCKEETSNLTDGNDYHISPVEFTNVKLTDEFWKPRIETSIDVTIPSSLQKCIETGRVENFKVAAGTREGAYQGVFPFDDSDVYKILEGASYSLSVRPDTALEKLMDEIIGYIADAQEPDGYLHTWRTIDPHKPPTTWSGNEHRWSDISGGHELYNMGHFYEAAAAHYRATGKRTLLDVAIKNADLILDTFGPEKNTTPPGHQEIELGLVKLYRVTGKRKYLDLAKYFLDQRGRTADRENLFGEYSQDHLPVQEQSEAVGHAVRAGYMYAAMTDIAAITGDSAYKAALDRIWQNVVNKKIYLTGGIGASRHGEAYGKNYDLPNFTAYNETCAAIASVYWNYRMFLMTGEGKYMDVLERTLYNGMISGVSLSGDHFFYPNPLASDGTHTFNMGSCTRSPWFDCSCCPSNISRFVPSIPGYIYAATEDVLYVNLFVGSSAELSIAGTEIKVVQQTGYPWDGRINIELEPEKSKEFELRIRIPGWTRNEVLPGNLYHYLNETGGDVALTVNGEETGFALDNNYAVLSRKWEKGDVIELVFPMDVRMVAASEMVKEDSGKVAVECGPIVYCAEEMDNTLGLFSVSGIPGDASFIKEFDPGFLGGINVIRTDVRYLPDGDQAVEAELTLIPYNVWSNRGPGKMSVWFPAEDR